MQHAAHKCQTLAAVAETKLQQQQQHRVLVVNFSQLTATFVQYAAFGYFTVGRRGCQSVWGGGVADLSPGARHKIKLENSQIFENFGFFLQFLFGNLFYLLLLLLLLPLFDGHLSESDATIINSDQKYIATKAKTSWKSSSIIAAIKGIS